jgi:predicted enzyme related to lactoylglutathione lyase
MTNQIVWFEIPVKDLDRAMKFYSKLMDCKLTKDQHEAVEYAFFSHSDDDVGGCLILDKNLRPSTDGPLIYLNTDNRIDEAIEIARKSGGKIIEEKKQIGPWGYRAIIIDSEGNKIALHSM